MLYWFFWQMTTYSLKFPTVIYSIICPNRYITLNNWIRKIIHTPTTWRLWLFAIVNSSWSIDVFFSFVKIWNRTEDRAPKTKTVIIIFLYEGIALSPEADPLIIISLCTYVKLHYTIKSHLRITSKWFLKAVSWILFRNKFTYQ